MSVDKKPVGKKETEAFLFLCCLKFGNLMPLKGSLMSIAIL